MNGAPKEKLLAKGGFVPTGLPDDFWSAMEPPLDPEVAEVVLGASHAEREPSTEEMPTRQGTIRNDGYVVRTLEAALWAFGRSTSFEEGCLLIANLGDDADTVAAIYGQLAGAFYGYSGIPAEWRNKIALKGLIEAMAEELFDMSNRIDPCPHPSTPASIIPSTSDTADAVAGGATLVMPTTEPPEQRVTRFVVKPAADEAGGGFQHGTHQGVGGGVDGNKERAGGAFWGGGVAAHYQRLEDAYVAIKTKIRARSYHTIEAFEQDVSAMILIRQPTPEPNTTTSEDAGGASKTAKHDDDNPESHEASTGKRTLRAEETVEKAKDALTEEFAARAAIDKVNVRMMLQTAMMLQT
ncbi:unnamed protein product [Ectocarpus sp. 12 AP-2014]